MSGLSDFYMFTGIVSKLVLLQLVVSGTLQRRLRLAHSVFNAAVRLVFSAIGDRNYSDASISLFRFRYDIATILTKYSDNDIDI